MAAGNDLGRLLAQLRSVSSPLERVKLIGRAWRSVKRLGPRERAVLARQIGIDGAEELIEGIAVSRGGLNPATVQQALDRLREVRPGRLKQTLKDLQDPERRRELIDRGLTAATKALAGPEEEESQEPPPAEAEPPATEPPPPPPPRPRPARPESAVPAAAAAVVAARKSAPAPAAREGTPPPRPVEPAEAPPARAPEKPWVVAEPEPPQAPPREKEQEPVAETADVRVDAGAASDLLRLVESQGTLFRRLRVLRENLDLAGEASPERLRAILDLFSAGWARRRVVSAMIEGRVPDSVEEAVFLIEQLESKADRRWCANTLLHEWELSAEQRELLAARHRPGQTAPGL